MIPDRAQVLATVTTNPQSALPLSVRLVVTGAATSGGTINARLVGSGGTGGYVYAADCSAFGGTLDTVTGEITGTYSGQGHFSIDATVQDSSTTVQPATLTLDVESRLYLGATALRAGPTIGEATVPYKYKFGNVLGATGTLSWTLVFGSTDGLTLHTTGYYDGTPTTAAVGKNWLTVRARDSGSGDTLDLRVVLLIRQHVGHVPPVFAVGIGTVNQPLGGTITIDPDCGVAPFRVEVTTGALPGGVSLPTSASASNVIPLAGTPSAITPFTVPTTPVATVTDALGATTTVDVPVQVNAPTPAAPKGHFVVGNSNDDGLPTSIDFMALFFGLGGDGAVVLDGVATYPADALSYAAGVYTLKRDIYVTDMTIATGVVLRCAGFAVFGSGTLDLSNADAGSIIASLPGLASPGSALAGGAGGAAAATGTLLPGAAGGGGAAGVTSGTPLNSTATTAPAPANGGDTYNSGATTGNGGAGSVGTFSTAGVTTAIAVRAAHPSPFGTLSVPAGGIAGGVGGCGGGAGGNNGTNRGMGGGGGGAGGSTMLIAFRTIKTDDTTTPIGVFQALGGNGGAGGGTSTAALGAGGGGKGGGGGYIHIRYAERIGNPVTRLALVSGGNGGNGGVNSANSARNGVGGDGGFGGRVEAVNVFACTIIGAVPAPPVSPSGTTGGTGGSAGATF